jgi:hypothetical protein
VASKAAFGECATEQTAKPSASRYVVKGGVVYDKKTDLTWMRCSQGQRWGEDIGCIGIAAKFTHAQANSGWSNGWRMPTVDELKTIVAKHCKDPAIDEEIFPDTPSEWYHTSTKNGSVCWGVNFRVADSSYYVYLSCDFGSHVRLVRGGQ